MSKLFQRKDGLFEYTKNWLDCAERERALGQLVKRVPRISPDLQKFLDLPVRSEESQEQETASP